jgi:ribonuclease P protein component
VARGFRPAQRLHTPAEFSRVLARGRRAGDALFGLGWLANELGHARLGLAIGGKAVGNAVARNRVKRLVRECFRTWPTELPAVDLVVTARSGARKQPPAALRDSLTRLLKKIAP